METRQAIREDTRRRPLGARYVQAHLERSTCQRPFNTLESKPYAYPAPVDPLAVEPAMPPVMVIAKT